VQRQLHSQGIYFEADMLESDAYFALNGTEIRVLNWFMSKRRFENKRSGQRRKRCDNLAELVFTYREAQSIGIPASTFERALKGLMAMGFLDLMQSGAGVCKSANVYGLSGRWHKYGTPAFRSHTAPCRPRYNGKVGFKEGHKPFGNQAFTNTTSGNGPVTGNGNGCGDAVTENGNSSQR
jgi:hypothetical protein